MKLIEYKPDISLVRTAIFEALWPIKQHQRRKVVEELSGYSYYHCSHVTLIIDTILIINEIATKVGINAQPRGMAIIVSINDVLTKTEPIRKEGELWKKGLRF